MGWGVDVCAHAGWARKKRKTNECRTNKGDFGFFPSFEENPVCNKGDV